MGKSVYKEKYNIISVSLLCSTNISKYLVSSVFGIFYVLILTSVGPSSLWQNSGYFSLLLPVARSLATANLEVSTDPYQSRVTGHCNSPGHVQHCCPWIFTQSKERPLAPVWSVLRHTDFYLFFSQYQG